MKRSCLIRFVALLWLVSGGALPASAETSFAIYTGTSATRDSRLHLVQPGAGTDLTVRDVHWSADPFKPAPYYGLRITHFPQPDSGWGLMLDYTHYKMYADTQAAVSAQGRVRGVAVAGPVPLNRFVQRFEISHGVNVLGLNAVYRLQEPTFMGLSWRPYVGAGIAHYRPHAETTVDGAPFETGYDASGFGYQLLAGAQHPLGQKTGFFVEARFNSGTARIRIAEGTAETPLRTFHLVAGISRSF